MCLPPASCPKVDAMTAKTVALIGTFDTKGEEFAFLRERIENAGMRTLTIDVGVLGNRSL